MKFERNDNMKKIYLHEPSNDTPVMCDCCIRAIKSRGETIYVGNFVDDEETDTCIWCSEPNEELYEVMF
jgi:hypothetical protein